MGCGAGTGPAGELDAQPRGEAVVVVVDERGPEEPVRPLPGEWPGLGEHDRHSWELRGGLAESVGHDGRPNVLKLEHCRVAVLDHDRGVLEGEVGEQVAQLAGGHAGDEICQALAFDSSDDDPVHVEA